jgi:uncharacterized protein YndB with AHSA1/START domain
MNGRLDPVGDRWRLRFERELRHPVEKVWRAVTEPEHLQAWFPQRVIGSWAVGEPLRFEAPDGEGGAFDGEVLACDPPSLLEFRWGTDTIRIELAADGDGCVLTLTDTIDELGKAARDGAGWHVCLDLLEHDLDGAAAPWSGRERWQEVHPGYVEAFGAEASAIGPPAGAL